MRNVKPARQVELADSEERQESKDPLSKQVSRTKARWLRRVMYSAASPMEKSFAYVIFDHLNCVTLDAWPGQETIAKLLGCSTKTVQRAANGLEQRHFVAITRSRGGLPRYAPIFSLEDLDNSVRKRGQVCPEMPDTNVYQSFSFNRSRSFSSGHRGSNVPQRPRSAYKPAERGRWEIELAARLGAGGLEMVDRLESGSKGTVDRLCQALCDGELGERELDAARLAARQMMTSRGNH
jgi:hypothetical protein